MNSNQQKVLQVLKKYVTGIDEDKLKQWLQFTENSDSKNAEVFIFEDARLADMYFEDEEDMASASGYFFPEGDLLECWEEVYCSDGADLEEDDEGDPRESYLGVINLSTLVYERMNGYGTTYAFNLKEKNAKRKNENPDFSDWIKS
jgi:hypothetical protein